MENYNDIINCRRPCSRSVHMPTAHRAKQFAPFAALKGYEEAIQSEEEIFSPYAELSDDRKEELDWKLRMLNYHDQITATYFRENESLPGCFGHYQTLTGNTEYLDSKKRKLCICGTEIDLKNLVDLQGDCFYAYY